MKRWWILGGAVTVIALVIGGVALFAGSFSPRGYVEKNFERASRYDIGNDAEAYTSPRSVESVAAEISKEWEPEARHSDASGTYLRYSDDAIVVKPQDGGSLILVEDADSAHRRYHSVVGSGWGPNNADGRGGGPGEGK